MPLQPLWAPICADHGGLACRADVKAAHHSLLGKPAGVRHFGRRAQAGPVRVFDRKATLTCCDVRNQRRLASPAVLSDQKRRRATWHFTPSAFGT